MWAQTVGINCVVKSVNKRWLGKVWAKQKQCTMYTNPRAFDNSYSVYNS